MTDDLASVEAALTAARGRRRAALAALRQAAHDISTLIARRAELLASAGDDPLAHRPYAAATAERAARRGVVAARREAIRTALLASDAPVTVRRLRTLIGDGWRDTSAYILRSDLAAIGAHRVGSGWAFLEESNEP